MPVELVIVPFELRPGAPPSGLSATAEGLGHSERVEARLIELAREEGRAMVLPDLVPNTHRAIVMAELARDAGARVHRPVHEAVFAAYYERGEDIGDPDVLLAIARRTGLDPDDVSAAWDDGRYEARLHEFLHLAINLGIDTTPTALICNELLIGSRPYGVVREAVQRCLVTPATLDAEERGDAS